MSDRAKFCQSCGASVANQPSDRASPPSTLAGSLGWLAGVITRDFTRGGPKAWVLGALIVLFAVFLFVYTRERAAQENSIAQQQRQDRANAPRKSDAAAPAETQGTVAGPTNGNPVDLKEQILNDARKTARKNYIGNMRGIFRENGVDASISDIDGELVIVSDLFKAKPNRDEILQRQFGPSVRQNLCTMGFNTLALKSGVLFGDGDEYSLCPETKEAREARLQDEFSARQKYIGSLQLGEGIQATQEHNEIVLTGSFAKDLSPQMMRAMWASKFDDQTKSNLCGIGFRGLRERTDARSRGTFISFGCGSR
jgi:hypothetical protein